MFTNPAFNLDLQMISVAPGKRQLKAGCIPAAGLMSLFSGHFGCDNAKTLGLTLDVLHVIKQAIYLLRTICMLTFYSVLLLPP